MLQKLVKIGLQQQLLVNAMAEYNKQYRPITRLRNILILLFCTIIF